MSFSDAVEGEAVRNSTLLLLVVGCGGGSMPLKPDADDAAQCDPICITNGWWIGRSANCDTICMSTSPPPECAHPDCEVIEASLYAGSTRSSIAPIARSAEARSFFAFAPATAKPYSVGSDCTLQLSGGSPEHFTCTGIGLVLPTATLALASDEEAKAFERAVANGPGDYTY
jgi:hypothetical protein